MKPSSAESRDNAGVYKDSNVRGSERVVRLSVFAVCHATHGTSGSTNNSVEIEPSPGSGWITGGIFGASFTLPIIFMLVRPSLFGNTGVWLRCPVERVINTVDAERCSSNSSVDDFINLALKVLRLSVQIVNDRTTILCRAVCRRQVFVRCFHVASSYSIPALASPDSVVIRVNLCFCLSRLALGGLNLASVLVATVSASLKRSIVFAKS